MTITKYLLSSILDTQKMGVFLAMERKAAAVSKKQMCKHYDMTVASINKIERGISVPRETLLKYLDAIGYDIEMILVKRKKEK